MRNHRIHIFTREICLVFLLLLCCCQIVVNLSAVYPKDVEAPPSGFDDMTKISYLHEPGVLHNLATRYEINEIYVRFTFAFTVESLLFFLVRSDAFISTVMGCSVITYLTSCRHTRETF